jgi:uncharacterized protein YcbK (DUF882 family)
MSEYELKRMGNIARNTLSSAQSAMTTASKREWEDNNNVDDDDNDGGLNDNNGMSEYELKRMGNIARNTSFSAQSAMTTASKREWEDNNNVDDDDNNGGLNDNNGMSEYELKRMGNIARNTSSSAQSAMTTASKREWEDNNNVDNDDNNDGGLNDNNGMSKYELKRMGNIARNNARLASLGLLVPMTSAPTLSSYPSNGKKRSASQDNVERRVQPKRNAKQLISYRDLDDHVIFKKSCPIDFSEMGEEDIVRKIMREDEAEYSPS